MSAEAFFAPLRPYIQAFDAWAHAATPPVRADHVGYRCASAQEFEELRAAFETESRFLYQSMISQRRIAVIGLRDPIHTTLGPIAILELADQKPDGSQVSGFDHIEMYPIAGTVEALVEHCATTGTPFQKTVRPHHTTYDAVLKDTFKIRLENESLIEKIKKDEMT